MEKEKVLIVSHYYTHYRLPILKKLLQDQTYDYWLCSGETTEIPIKIFSGEDLNEVSRSLTNENRWLRLKNHWLGNLILWQSGLLSLIISNRYKHVIFLGNPYFLSSWLAIPLARMLGIKTYLWTHGAVRGNSLKDRLRLRFFKLGHCLLLYGNWAKQNLVNAGFSSEKLAVIYNSLDYDCHKKLRASIDQKELDQIKKELFNNDLPLLIFIGRLTPQKQLDKLLLSVKALKETGKPVNLLIVGDGTETGTLQKQSEAMGINENVHFYGSSYDEETNARLLMASDLCVSPGEVGLTAMHSLGFGTPVITHNQPMLQMPEFEAISKGISGDFYDATKPSDLADKILSWLEKQSTVDIQDRREKCFSIIEKYYNPETQINIINRLISGESVSSIENDIGKPDSIDKIT